MIDASAAVTRSHVGWPASTMALSFAYSPDHCASLILIPVSFSNGSKNAFRCASWNAPPYEQTTSSRGGAVVAVVAVGAFVACSPRHAENRRSANAQVARVVFRNVFFMV